MSQSEVIPLQGRDDELERLVAHAGAAKTGQVTIALLHGEPGIGKTRLLAESQAKLVEDGFALRRGRAEELGVLRPLGPVIDALELQIPEPAEESEGGAEVWHYRTLQLALAAVETMTRAAPLLLVLDDIQWADATTLGFLRALGPRLAGRPLALLAAHRAVPRDPQFNAAIDAVVEVGALQIELGPLPDPAVRDLAQMILNAAPGEELMQWARGAGGNPLYITELLRSAAEAGRLAIVADQAVLTQEPLPRALSVLLERRVTALGPETVDVLNVGAVLGDGFLPHVLAGLMAKTTASLQPAIQEALAAGVLHMREDRLIFRHDLVREAVYRRIPAPVRCSLHLEAARTLLAAEAPAGIVAAHLLRSGEDPAIVPLLRLTAEQLAHTAPGPAADLLDRALELMGPGHAESAGTSVALVRLLAWAGRPEEAAVRADTALASGIDGGAEARLRVGLAEAMIFRGLPHGVLVQLERARRLPALTDAQLAPLLAAAAHARLFTGELDEVEGDATAAISTADRVGDQASACFAQLARVIRFRNAGRLDQSLAAGEDAVRRADNGPMEARQRHPRLFLAPTLFALGRVEEADDAYLKGRAAAEALGSVWALPVYAAFRAINLRWWGHWEEALAEAEAAVQLGDELGQPNVTPLACAVLIDIHAHRNELVSAERYLRLGESLIQSGVKWTAQFFVWGAASYADARGDSQAAAARLVAGGLEAGVLGLLTMESGPAPQMVRILLAAGERTRAQQVGLAAERVAAMNPQVVSLRAGALHCRGLLEDDAAKLAQSAEAFASTPFLPALAAACEDAGTAAARIDERPRAEALLRRAHDLQTGFEAGRDVARVEGHLRAFGFSRRGGRKRSRGDSGWESLTPAELRIAQLVAEGLSNPQIAGRLYISRYTVESHLKHVFNKLRITSRVELATLAVRNQNEDP